MNNLQMLVIISSIIILLGVLVFIFVKEKYELMTMGNFGHPEPPSCYETEPAVRFKNLYTCNACSLGCSSKESWEKCLDCQQNLSSKVEGVMM
jgi:hypothetical protein